MKFDYVEENAKEVVAYIGEMGTEQEFLVVKSRDGLVVVFYRNGDIENGFWNPVEESNHIFYKGDKITITF